MTVPEVRALLGEDAGDMTDAQIAELYEHMQDSARGLIRMFFDRRSQGLDTFDGRRPLPSPTQWEDLPC